MKKLITIMTLFFAFITCKAQQEIKYIFKDKSYTVGFDSITSNLRHDSITTGVLYNRVIPWSNLTTFNDSTKVDSDKLYQAWFELYNATYNNSNVKTAEFIRLQSAYYDQFDTLNLAAINYNYNVYRLQCDCRFKFNFA